HRFYNKVGISLDQVHRFNAKSENLEEECMKACDYLDQFGPIDLVILGVGMNGHVGFNEPYTEESSRAFYKDLEEISTCMGQKYFSHKLNLKQGITLGLKDLLDAKHVIIQVTGAHKAEIVKLLMEHERDIALPVTLFKDRKNTKIFIDEQAGSLLQENQYHVAY
ncbi:MAG: 6-phosphogluconolactonase, partial [Turicibacter sp.]